MGAGQGALPREGCGPRAAVQLCFAGTSAATGMSAALAARPFVPQGRVSGPGRAEDPLPRRSVPPGGGRAAGLPSWRRAGRAGFPSPQGPETRALLLPPPPSAGPGGAERRPAGSVWDRHRGPSRAWKRLLNARIPARGPEPSRSPRVTRPKQPSAVCAGRTGCELRRGPAPLQGGAAARGRTRAGCRVLGP